MFVEVARSKLQSRDATPAEAGPGWNGRSNDAPHLVKDVPQLGPGLRRGGAYSLGSRYRASASAISFREFATPYSAMKLPIRGPCSDPSNVSYSALNQSRRFSKPPVLPIS
jgi:hypothetical protein